MSNCSSCSVGAYGKEALCSLSRDLNNDYEFSPGEAAVAAAAAVAAPNAAPGADLCSSC